jgi:hypothetical protein
VVSVRSRVACTLVLALATSSHADDNAARASKLFEEGRALVKGGKLTEACNKFDESFTLDAQTGTQVNLADCFEKTGKLRAAWQQFDAAAIESLRAGNSVRAKFARDRADALDTRLTHIVVHVAESQLAGLAIKIGDHEVTPAAEIHDRVVPGDVAVVVSAPKRKDFRSELHATAGATVDVSVILEPIEPNVVTKPVEPPVAVVATPAAPTSYDIQREPGRVHIAYALGATSIATGLTGLGIAFYAKHAYDDAVSKHDIATANHEVHVSDVGTGFAVASLARGAAAAIVYFTAPRERVVVMPSASSNAASVTVFARF